MEGRRVKPPSHMPELLRRWIAREYDYARIANARIYEDEGSPGYSEWTPHEPWELEVHFDYDGTLTRIPIRPGDVAAFIGELVAIGANAEDWAKS